MEKLKPHSDPDFREKAKEAGMAALQKFMPERIGFKGVFTLSREALEFRNEELIRMGFEPIGIYGVTDGK